MLLGISNVKFSVTIKSDQMTLNIHDSGIQDVTSLMDALFKISNMFNDNLNTSISLRFEEEMEIDEDFASTIFEFSNLRDELIFRSEIEKLISEES